MEVSADVYIAVPGIHHPVQVELDGEVDAEEERRRCDDASADRVQVGILPRERIARRITCWSRCGIRTPPVGPLQTEACGTGSDS